MYLAGFHELVSTHGFVAALIVTSLASPAIADGFRWTQYVPGGIEARAITDKPDCPSATINGAPAPMAKRSAPGPNYPMLVCALPLPRTATAVTVDGFPLPLPVTRPNRILLIGDTGCRLKDSFVQACNDTALWPFQVGADVASLLRPDLVIHVGDFHYRETACPAGNVGCAGSPFGDTWRSGARISLRRPGCCSKRRLGSSCAAITRSAIAAALVGRARSIPIPSIRRRALMAA
jgi:hypothetical protein